LLFSHLSRAFTTRFRAPVIAGREKYELQRLDKLMLSNKDDPQRAADQENLEEKEGTEIREKQNQQ
jgi:hypothetical protein